jgi:hypothetical protein
VIATAPIGHNQPPEPFDAYTLEIEDLYAEATNYLDGEPIANQAQADDVSAIVNRLRKVITDADEARKTEKRPHDEAAKAVQAKWKPLLDKADLAASTARNALAPFLKKQEDAQQAAAEALRKEAEEKAEAAAQAAQDMAPDNLAGQAWLRAARDEAAAIGKAAQKAAKGRVHAKGGERAIGLRSAWTPVLSDSCAALKHYRARQPEELKAWLLEQAEKDVRAGARIIPGFTITEDRKAQ